jgi:hypothetical protein
MIYVDQHYPYYTITRDISRLRPLDIEFFGSLNEIDHLTVLEYLPMDIDRFIGKNIEDLWIDKRVKKLFSSRYIILNTKHYQVIMPKNELNKALYDL